MTCYSWIHVKCSLFLYANWIKLTKTVNHLKNKCSGHEVRCENIQALHILFTHWYMTSCHFSLAACFSCSLLPYLVIPKVTVRATVNHLCSVSRVVKMTSVGLWGCVQSQFSVQLCSLSCQAAKYSWVGLPHRLWWLPLWPDKLQGHWLCGYLSHDLNS